MYVYISVSVRVYILHHINSIMHRITARLVFDGVCVCVSAHTAILHQMANFAQTFPSGISMHACMYVCMYGQNGRAQI